MSNEVEAPRHRIVTTAIISSGDNACICGTCAFWDHDGTDDPGKGLCRRRSPTLHVVNSQFAWAFPATTVETWCGDWKRRGGELVITEEMLRAGAEVALQFSSRVTPLELAGAVYEAMTIARLKS